MKNKINYGKKVNVIVKKPSPTFKGNPRGRKIAYGK